jgi:hypothetical protein
MGGDEMDNDENKANPAVPARALSQVLQKGATEEGAKEILDELRAMPDAVLDMSARAAGVPEEQFELHRAMVRQEPNAFVQELGAVDGLLRPGDVILMTNPASMALVDLQKKLYDQARSSHVALIHTDFLCVDAMPKVGVSNRTIAALLESARDDWRVIRCSTVQDTDAMMLACAYYLAQPYKVLPAKRSAKSFAYCSELVRKVYVHCGLNGVGIPNDYVIAPAHFDMLADGAAGKPNWEDITAQVRPAIALCLKYPALIDITTKLTVEGLMLNRERFHERTRWLDTIKNRERSGQISKSKAEELRGVIYDMESKMNHKFWDVRRPATSPAAPGGEPAA